MRRIIICADGTWNEPDKESEDYDARRPTNIVKIARGVRPTAADGTSQIVYYDQGVGTANFTDKLLGGLTGVGIVENILAAYRFLVHNYEEGDEIFLFGFSRGAYTVRSLSGLLASIGLLPKDNVYWLPEGYALYRKNDGDNILEEYRAKNNSKIPRIKAISVFDTVGALGIPVSFMGWLNEKRHGFHNTELSINVEHAFHAVAIDERRAAFAPTLWRKRAAESQTMEQVWFAGVHSGIGGSYNDDSLANCALNWIVEKMESLKLEFDQEYMGYFRQNPHGPFFESRKRFYRITREHVREIGRDPDQFQNVHETAIQRMNNPENNYKPVNLLSYVESQRNG